MKTARTIGPPLNFNSLKWFNGRSNGLRDNFVGHPEPKSSPKLPDKQCRLLRSTFETESREDPHGPNRLQSLSFGNLPGPLLVTNEKIQMLFLALDKGFRFSITKFKPAEIEVCPVGSSTWLQEAGIVELP
jgi:hypothetical protein